MIKLNNICAGYGSRTILNKLTLHIAPGEFVHVLGENGAGKSTLFNVLMGKIPHQGSIMLSDTKHNYLTSKQMAQYIAYVSQNTLHGTVPEFTVQENMELALLRGKAASLCFRKPDIQNIKTQLSACELGLEDRLHTHAKNLSGGQRQALSLIMALQQTPKILLLDEHTSALDPNTAKRIMALTHKMVKHHHITCIMITHNLQDAIQYGDRILILHQGNVEKDFNKQTNKNLDHHQLVDIMLEVGKSSC